MWSCPKSVSSTAIVHSPIGQATAPRWRQHGPPRLLLGKRERANARDGPERTRAMSKRTHGKCERNNLHEQTDERTKRLSPRQETNELTHGLPNFASTFFAPAVISLFSFGLATRQTTKILPFCYCLLLDPARTWRAGLYERETVITLYLISSNSIYSTRSYTSL